MLASLISWSLRNRLVVVALTILVCAAGVTALRNLNIDAFPDTTPVQVQINTVASAMVPEEIERQITFPVELAMGGMPGVESLRSVSQFGLSQVVVTFRDGTGIYFARQLINERLSTVELPSGVERPEMGPVSTGLGEVFHYLVVPENGDLTAARTLQDWTIKPALRPVPGVAEINPWGGMKKQYQIRVDPQQLIKYGLTFQNVITAVPANNLNVGGGNIKQGGDTVLVHGVGRTVNSEEIGNIVLSARGGVPIRIRDVGEVVVGHEIRRGLVTANAQGEVVLGLGFMLMGENSYAVTNAMREKFEELKTQLPPGYRLETVYDRTTLVNRVIETVKNNLCEGAYLVIVILFLLLGNLRAGLIAAASIPLAMMFGFCGMWSAGIAGSLLSLGAIDFGIVVDSSVVVIENIIRRLGHAGEVSREDRLKIIRDAAIEVRTPTVFGQLIIMIVYLPILSLEGVEGKMFRPMALTVIFILIGSLIMSLTMTPILSHWFLPRRVEEREVWLVRFAKRIYEPVLHFALRNRWAVLMVAVTALVMTGRYALQMGSEFVPRLSEGDVVIGILRAPGTSLETTGIVNTEIERLLLQKFPDEVAHIWSRTGAPEVATDAGALEATDMFVSLKPREQWKRAQTQQQLVELMNEVVNDFPGQIVWFTQPIEQRINEMISGVRADVALKVFGDDFATLIPKAQELQRVLAGIQGAADLMMEQVDGQPILRIRVRQDDLARYGVTAEAVLSLIESIGSKPVGEVVEGQLRFPLVVRLPDEFRTGGPAIEQILLSTPSGERIPLSRLADVELITGPKMITREWGRRRITVQCNVRGRDVGSFVADAQKLIAEKVELPASQFRIEWGGQFENMQRAQQRLMIVVPLALCLIIGLLYATYRNLIDSAFVFASVPFACLGGVIMLMWREMPLSISAAVGFITLSGVSVLNSMILVSSLRQRLAEGHALADALPEVAVESLRTVLMTALVASVGFIPMAVSQGSGAEVQRPLATVVIGGVVSSTGMTLLVLPVLYSFLAPRRRSGETAESEQGSRRSQPEPVTI
ncbi:MAG: CusA/CzcA family heavy metal efflux RND transporter [Planctomycetaceae bacterium]